MSVISFAVIGKNRQPIYVKEFSRDHNHNKNKSHTEDDWQLFGIASTSTTASTSPTNVLEDHRRPSLLSSTGKNINAEGQCDCSIRQQFIIHDALDYMEQWIERRPVTMPSSPPQNAHDAMFAGLLCPIEDMRVYGTSNRDVLLFA